MDQIVKGFKIANFLLSEIFKLFPIFVQLFINCFISKSRKSVSGQLALVTGGSEGFGRALAFRLAQEGCNIAIASRNLENGQKTAEEIRNKYNVKVQAFQCDVSKREDVKRLKDEVKKSLGIVDLLINNAGLLPVTCSTLEGQDEEYQNIVDINMTSWMWTTRTFLPDMIQQRRGHIVGISSISTVCPIISSAVYMATKYGNKGYMEGLREDICFYEFSEFIKVTTAFPGFIKTNEDYFKLVFSNFHDYLITVSEPDFVAEKIIDGVLKNYENIFVSKFEMFQCWLLNSLPREVKTQCIKGSMPTNQRDKYLKMKLQQCKLLENY
ncbi:hypothetical protein ACKWTF_016378 [Chironomus riparius]